MALKVSHSQDDIVYADDAEKRSKVLTDRETD